MTKNEEQTLKELMIKYGFKAPDMTVTEFVEDVLPSAQSQHWTDKTDPEWDGEWGDWQCPYCGAMIMSMAINLNGVYLYCPKCGERVEGER